MPLYLPFIFYTPKFNFHLPYVNKQKLYTSSLSRINYATNKVTYTSQNLAKKLIFPIMEYINKPQDNQHSNASGGICCAATSASHAIVDDIAQASNGAGAKQYHNFEAHNISDVVSAILTSISNPLILHSSLGLWRELNHQHKKYQKIKSNIKQDILANQPRQLNMFIAKKYVAMQSSIFRLEKHLTSWVTALSATLVVLKFSAEYVLSIGLLISATKSFIKVIQRLIQITNKILDIKYNAIEEKKCQQSLEKMQQQLKLLLEQLELKQQSNDIETQNLQQELKNLTQNISSNTRDKQRYPKLKQHFIQDISLYALDSLFWLANGVANLGMTITNLMASSHGFPIVAILTLILGSTAGVIFSNNKLLTGRYAAGLTESEAGAINQHNYTKFDLTNAKQEFDLYYELHKIFKNTNKQLNQPFTTKLKINLACVGVKLLMFASFGTFSDDIIALKRKFRAYKAKIYKASDKNLIDWIQEINKAQQQINAIYTVENSSKNLSKNLENKQQSTFHQSLKSFSKSTYVVKELTYTIASFKTNNWQQVKNLTKKLYISTHKWQTLKQEIKQLNFKRKELILKKDYQYLLDLNLITQETLHYYFTNGTCCIGENEMEDLIDDFYTKINLKRQKNLDETKILLENIELSLANFQQNKIIFTKLIERLNLPFNLNQQINLHLKNCLLTPNYTTNNFYVELENYLHKGQMHIFEYNKIFQECNKLFEKAKQINQNCQTLTQLSIIDKSKFNLLINNVTNNNINITQFYEYLKEENKSAINEKQYQLYVDNFESLLRQSVKSTFATAGKQYARRYMSHAANIIALHHRYK